MRVQMGYFENVKSANTIIVSGDEDGLQGLASVLRTLEDANARPVELHLLPFAEVHGDVELTAYPVDREMGVRRLDSALCFHWHHSAEGWLESAEKIEAVARGSGGHCYLGATPAGDAVVMVSKGEYDESWWERQGVTMKPFGHQAAILCCGYSMGYYKEADIEHWAERQINALNEPPLPLIELATVRGMYPIDVMNLLRSLSGAFPPSLIAEAQIGFLGLLYHSKKIPLKRAIGGLFAMVHDEDVTDDQRSMIYGLDDMYDLAIAGTYGTVGQVEAEFRSFVQPYVEKLNAQEIEMLGVVTG